MNKGIQLGRGVQSSNSNAFNLANSLKSLYNNIKKRFKIQDTAFTLAETLIVMGIIGVVAALTIPNLNSSTNNMEKVAKVKKIYAELNEAQNRATAVYGPIETWFVNDSTEKECHKRYFDRITEFIKTTKICPEDDGDSCIGGNEAKFLNGDGLAVFNEYSAILAGGSSFGEGSSFDKSCRAAWINGSSKGCAMLTVDIDGPNKGKNTLGIDLFEFSITGEGIIPYNLGAPLKFCFTDGRCTSWVIQNGNMDYLDASHEESTAGKCKHSDKTLSTTVTSCK